MRGRGRKLSMNIFDRARLAVSVMFGTKGIATLLPTFLRGKAQWSTGNLYNMVTKGYTANELIWRCIQERSNSASAPRMLVRSKRTKEIITDHPLVDLIHRPNHRMSQFDLWSISIIYADLTGLCYWEQMRGPMGNTIELWPLRPDRMHPIPDSQKVVSGYEYRIPGLEPVHIPAENVIEYQVFDPLSLYKGIAPAQVAAKALDIDIAQTNYLKLFFESGGMPPGLIKTKKKLLEADVTDIRRRWRQRYGGFEHWMEPAVLDLDAEYMKTGFSFEEMGFEVLDARSEIRVCMSFMVPPILIGARVGLERATYANFREARTAFWEETMVPMFNHLRDTFQREIADEEWNDVEFVWDFSNVPVLFAKNLEQRAQHRADFLAGGLLLDEYRTYMGFPPLPKDTGRVRVQSLAFQIIPEGERGQLVPLRQPVGVGDTKVRTIHDVRAELKSPACRIKGETVAACVKRKIPEIKKEHPDWDMDHVLGAAYGMCRVPCKEFQPGSDGHKAGEGPLPSATERDVVVVQAVATAQEALDEQQERVTDAVG